MAARIVRKNTRTKIFLLIAGLFSVFLPTPSLSAKSLILTNGEWPPFFSEQLNHGGFGTRIVTEAFVYSDTQVSFHYVPWKRGLDLAAHGHSDGSVGWRKSKQWERLFLFSDPLFPVDTVFLHKKSNPIEWESPEDLGHLSIGGTLGYLYVDKLRSITRHNNGKLELASSDEINLRKLLSGRIDIFPCPKMVAYYIMHARIDPEKAQFITYHPKPLLRGPVHLLISKKVPGAQRIIAQFNKGLRQLKESGQYERFILESMEEMKTMRPHPNSEPDGQPLF